MGKRSRRSVKRRKSVGGSRGSYLSFIKEYEKSALVGKISMLVVAYILHPEVPLDTLLIQGISAQIAVSAVFHFIYYIVDRLVGDARSRGETIRSAKMVSIVFACTAICFKVFGKDKINEFIEKYTPYSLASY